MVRGIWDGTCGVALHVPFWGLIIVGLVLLIRWLWDHGRPGMGSAEAPLDILKRRYARGEITKEEFERMKQDLL